MIYLCLKHFLIGKVPAVLEGDKILVESLDICDYLDDHYPQNPLYPAEPAAKEKDKEIIKKINPATIAYYKNMYGTDEKSPAALLKDLLEPLQPLEDELASRNTTFFGGDKPGMVYKIIH